MQHIVNGFSLGAVYALIAVGFALIYNILKFANFAHGGVMVISAYFGYFLSKNFHTSLFTTLIITTLFGGLCAVIVELIAFHKIRHNNSPLIYYFVSSLVITLMIENLIAIFKGATSYAYPVFFKETSFLFGETVISYVNTLIFIISSVILIILMWLIKYTKFGIALRAISFNLGVSKLMGINADGVIIITFFISGLLAGASGMFLGISYTVYPQLARIVVKGWIATVIGGMGSISGAVIGAFALGLFEVFLISNIGSSLSTVFIFLITLGFLFLRPQGIAGEIFTEKA